MGDKQKVLCLHGWRTSGKILSMQTAAMQFHTPIEYYFIDAPFPADGPPDMGIQTYYPNRAYFEWHKKRLDNSPPPYEGLHFSTEMLIQYLKSNGPFDGILGFSQGAAMVARLSYLQCANHPSFENSALFKFAILIGGIAPMDIDSKVHYNSTLC